MSTSHILLFFKALEFPVLLQTLKTTVRFSKPQGLLIALLIFWVFLTLLWNHGLRWEEKCLVNAEIRSLHFLSLKSWPWDSCVLVMHYWFQQLLQIFSKYSLFIVAINKRVEPEQPNPLLMEELPFFWFLKMYVEDDVMNCHDVSNLV